MFRCLSCLHEIIICFIDSWSTSERYKFKLIKFLRFFNSSKLFSVWFLLLELFIQPIRLKWVKLIQLAEINFNKLPSTYVQLSSFSVVKDLDELVKNLVKIPSLDQLERIVFYCKNSYLSIIAGDFSLVHDRLIILISSVKSANKSIKLSSILQNKNIF